MPTFTHVSTYPHPRAEVFAWHRRPGGFTRLTPPGMATLVGGPTDGINVGSELNLVMSDPIVAGLLPHIGRRPVGLSWTVRHADLVEGERFVDEQISGPLKSWTHEHLFSDAPGGGTTITDRVTWTPPVPLPALAEAIITRRLAALFRFRERQLRGDLALHARLRAAPRTVVVSGASGLIGTQVIALLTTGGHRVTPLVRGENWDPDAGRLDPAALEGADAVVHLAGHSIAGRFTASHKSQILDSRLRSTALIADALAEPDMPRTLVQASAIGIYGPRRPHELLNEDSARGAGFLADVVAAWEATARPAEANGVRATYLRTGIVLSGGGGALLPQLPLFLVGAGGRLTAPDAMTSWITLDDMARAYVHAVFTDELTGPVNAVAPNPATSSEFAKTLGEALHRPAALPTPAVGPRLVLGREGASELVETDQHVSARKLTSSGFRFEQSQLSDAFAHVLVR